MDNFQKAGDHLKHLSCSELSALLLASCIASRNYNNALKILREQKKLKSTDASPLEFLNEEPFELLENEAYSLIGEYLANCGSSDYRGGILLRIRYLVLELQRRDRI